MRVPIAELRRLSERAVRWRGGSMLVGHLRVDLLVALIRSGFVHATLSTPSTRVLLVRAVRTVITACVARRGMRGSMISRGRVRMLCSVAHWLVWLLC